MSNTINTRGHLAGSGGIRGHSAGDIFPYMVLTVGGGEHGYTYHVVGNGIVYSNEHSIPYETAADAIIAARNLLAQG